VQIQNADQATPLTPLQSSQFTSRAFPAQQPAIMATGKHLQPFNPRFESPAASFDYFGRLHRELRMHIWELVLHRERIFHIELTDEGQGGSSGLTARNGDYSVIVKGPHVTSKVLHISGESRDVALRFYRESASKRSVCNKD
jgi:hypothetical protein